VEVQFEPPRDLDVIDRVHDMGIASVGIHVETFDPRVLARIAPAKARTGIDGYFRAWERAVAAFGEGQVSTYVILGMGEDPDLIVAGCRRAIDIGVYPFVVPLRPTVGSLMEDLGRPVARVLRDDLPPGRALPQRAGPGRPRRRGRLRPLPGVLRDEPARGESRRGWPHPPTAPHQPLAARPRPGPPRPR
jgi:biotin synthase-related radical SAM superfamily protein